MIDCHETNHAAEPEACQPNGVQALTGAGGHTIIVHALMQPLQPEDLGTLKSVSYSALFQEVAKHGFARTNGEARRLVRGGGIWVNGKKATDENMLLMSGDVVSMCHDTPKKREFTVGSSAQQETRHD